jgi:hypothetical protein
MTSGCGKIGHMKLGCTIYQRKMEKFENKLRKYYLKDRTTWTLQISQTRLSGSTLPQTLP